jgi:hypothetical protein
MKTKNNSTETVAAAPEAAENKKPAKKSRAHTVRTAKLIRRAAKKLDELSAELTDQDVALALDRLRSQLDATKKIWDMEAKCLIDIPDEKIRFDAAVMILAYKWGRPVEKQMVASGSLTDMNELLARLDESDAYQDFLQKTVEGKEIPPALPAQKSETG